MPEYVEKRRFIATINDASGIDPSSLQFTINELTEPYKRWREHTVTTKEVNGCVQIAMEFPYWNPDPETEEEILEHFRMCLYGDDCSVDMETWTLGNDGKPNSRAKVIHWWGNPAIPVPTEDVCGGRFSAQNIVLLAAVDRVASVIGYDRYERWAAKNRWSNRLIRALVAGQAATA